MSTSLKMGDNGANVYVNDLANCFNISVTYYSDMAVINEHTGIWRRRQITYMANKTKQTKRERERGVVVVVEEVVCV